jgi:D-sedoheptulose 7-phosphate isomerase
MQPDAEHEPMRIVQRTLDEAIALHQRVRAQAVAPVVRAADAIVAALADGSKVLAFGNGGSAADAQHLVAELVGRFQRDRRGFAALALTVDTSVMTSIANDYGFDRVFARQIEALGRRGDVAVAISTSGESANVLAALEAARSQGLRTIALTGRSGGRVGAAAEIHVNVPDANAARIQEVHRTLIHAICEIVETERAEAVDSNPQPVNP